VWQIVGLPVNWGGSARSGAAETDEGEELQCDGELDLH